jgi:hypothetical protein
MRINQRYQIRFDGVTTRGFGKMRRGALSLNASTPSAGCS